jgi:STE24 endopeptidase
MSRYDVGFLLCDAMPDFSQDEVERARRYHAPLYLALAIDLLLGLALLSLLAFTPAGDRLFDPFERLAWWAGALGYPALIVGASAMVRLPLSFWRGYIHERRWGFSTQSIGGWLADRAKALGIGAVLTSVVLFSLLGMVRILPVAWPAVAAPATAGFVLLISFVAPLVLEPVFLRFRPLSDAALAADLRGLAERAGVPIRDVLVADASRRTRKENAYVSGLGRTRRVVVFDTLLARNEPRQLSLVVAHELGHRRMRHMAKATGVGMAGAVAGVMVMWGVLESDALLHAARSSGPGDPRIVPFVLLVGAVLQLMASPLASAQSRRWESAADLFSLELTGDLTVFEASFRSLARSNLSDLDPPRILYLWAFTHPTPPERLEAARRWAARSSGDGPPVARGRAGPS